MEGELQVSFLERLKDALAPIIEQNGSITIDVSGITEVDVAGLQLILSFLLSRQDRAQTRLTGVGDVFKRALQLTGLAEQYAPFTG